MTNHFNVYKILSSDNISKLEKTINEYSSNGWNMTHNVLSIVGRHPDEYIVVMCRSILYMDKEEMEKLGVEPNNVCG